MRVNLESFGMKYIVFLVTTLCPGDWIYYPLLVVIRRYGIHFLVHHYGNCIPAVQPRSVACRYCVTLLLYCNGRRR